MAPVVDATDTMLETMFSDTKSKERLIKLLGLVILKNTDIWSHAMQAEFDCVRSEILESLGL